MRADLGAGPCSDMLLHLLPVLSIELERLHEAGVLFLGPAAGVAAGLASAALLGLLGRTAGQVMIHSSKRYNYFIWWQGIKLDL